MVERSMVCAHRRVSCVSRISGSRTIFRDFGFCLGTRGIRRPVQRGAAVFGRCGLVMARGMRRTISHVKAGVSGVGNVSSLIRRSHRTRVVPLISTCVVPASMRTKTSATAADVRASAAAMPATSPTAMSAATAGVACECGGKRQAGHAHTRDNCGESSNPAPRANLL